MPAAAVKRLAALPNISAHVAAPLSSLTRFQIGGPAAVLCDSADAQAFTEALRLTNILAVPSVIIGGGTNLVVADAGFDGVVLRFTGARISRVGEVLRAQSGAVLQDVVDASIGFGLEGLQTMTGIPGNLGGAVYGNAGAYGHSIQEIVENVQVTDGDRVFTMGNADCQFGYRESVFKERKNWVILSTDLNFRTGDRDVLSKAAREIRTIRDAKYPPTMKCAGSVFKNVFFAELPANAQSEVPNNLVRDGKVPSAWFLERANAKGMRRGDIQVATYHANLIYNDGAGTAADLVAVIQELKKRVRARFGFDLQEEVQYLGFDYAHSPT